MPEDNTSLKIFDCPVNWCPSERPDLVGISLKPGVVSKIMSTATEAPPRPREAGRLSYSSSPGLSSPPSPHSPSNATTPNASFTHTVPILPSQHDHVNVNIVNGGGEHLVQPGFAKETAPAKKPRKKREPKIKGENGKSSTATAADGKEAVVKVRKSRGTSTASSSTLGRKRKVVGTESNDAKCPTTQTLPRQTKLTDSVRSSFLPSDFDVPRVPSHKLGDDEVIPKSTEPPQIPVATPRSTSGQNYDPIRSSTIEPRARSPPNSFSVPVRSPTPTRPLHPKYGSASASPSIASLIEPNPSSHPDGYSQPSKRSADSAKATSSSTTKKLRLSPPADNHVNQSVALDAQGPSTDQALSHNVMDQTNVDSNEPIQGNKSSVPVKKSTTSASTGPSSTSHSPKPSRQREAPAIVSSGNGLLSSAMFGGADESTGVEKSAPTVVLHVPLDGGGNKYVNFARMAEEQYGFNALHPRLAAQRERLARVAAAGAALENAHKGAGNSPSGISADEMSVDLSENDGAGEDSNVEMGGIGLTAGPLSSLGRSGKDESEGGAMKKVPKKRMMKEDQYDKDDPFVDDTELAWEEQAAASKDGFFVYSGPLVPQGEKPNVERSAPRSSS